MPKLPQPIPYQGSKRNLAREIFAFLPNRIDRLVEPFAGSAALSVYAAANQLADRYYLNDLNAPLIALLELIVNDPERIAHLYSELWHAQLGQERGFYDDVRERFNRTQAPEYLLFLLARCVKASVRYNNAGAFNQGPDNRRRGRHPVSMRQEIMAKSRLLRGRTLFSHVDYRELPARLNPATDVVYMDPPYQGTSANRDRRYLGGIDVNEFASFLAELNALEVMYAVSYDGHKGGKRYGITLPSYLCLRHIEINAGRSSQSTLLGEQHITYESLYLSPALVGRLNSRHSAVLFQPEQASFEFDR